MATIAKRGSGPLPLSEIRRRVEECLLDKPGIHFIPPDALGITPVLCVHKDCKVYAPGYGIIMPPDLAARYEELYEVFQRVSRDHSDWESIFPWELYKVSVDGTDYYVGWVDPEGSITWPDGEAGENPDWWKNMYLYPCDQVDPDS